MKSKQLKSDTRRMFGVDDISIADDIISNLRNMIQRDSNGRPIINATIDIEVEVIFKKEFCDEIELFPPSVKNPQNDLAKIIHFIFSDTNCNSSNGKRELAIAYPKYYMALLGNPYKDIVEINRLPASYLSTTKLAGIIKVLQKYVRKNMIYYTLNTIVEYADDEELETDNVDIGSSNEAEKRPTYTGVQQFKKESDEDTNILDGDNDANISKIALEAVRLAMAEQQTSSVGCHMELAKELIFIKDRGTICDIGTISYHNDRRISQTECSNIADYILLAKLTSQLRTKIELLFECYVDDSVVPTELYSIRLEVLYINGAKRVFVQGKENSKIIKSENGNTEQLLFDMSNPKEVEDLPMIIATYIMKGSSYASKLSSDWQLTIKSI